MSELMILSGKLKGKKLILPPKEMVVGRDEDCDLRIASTLVSRKHCKLLSTHEGIVVTDLDSQNGTHVNDVPITEPMLLREGDVLRIGATVLAVPTPVVVAAQPRIHLPPENQTQISESEIADWLTEPNTNFSGSDTAVISMSRSGKPKPVESRPQPAAPTPVAATAAAAAVPAATSRPASSKPLSIKEEAAEVIRKHWERIKSKQQ